MSPQPYGSLPSGQRIEAYTLANASGASVQVITYGGIITSLRVPDRAGHYADVVLGFNGLASYAAGHPFFGAIVGRIAGRVTGGRLIVEGRSYPLALTDGPNHLHGGRIGFDKRVWTAQPVKRADGADSLRLTYRSPDGEEGYPGTLDIAVTYSLTAGYELIIETEATADRSTPLSLTNHSYFNLAGEGSGSVADHEIQIHADAFVPTDDSLTLSGRREPVAGHACDFNRPRRLGDVLPQLFKSHGDVYVLGDGTGGGAMEPRAVAHVVEPHSGRKLTVSTNEPCLQFYTGIALDGTFVGKSGRPYGRHAGLCLECEGYPDGASLPELGDIMVYPDRPQRRTTIYAFSMV